MTLIVGLANRQHAILVSDRRLTRNGVPYDEESNKAAVFHCGDGRFAVAFTGLAEWGPRAPWKDGPPPPGHFLARWWLLNALPESAPPDYLSIPSIERFSARATRDIMALPGLRSADKALSVMFAGFVYDESPRACGCVVSNFEWNPGGIPGDTFAVKGWREKRPGDGNPAGVFMAGMTAGVSEERQRALMKLLEEDAPAATLTGKAVQLIREAAESPASRNLIGKQCTSILLPADPAEQPSLQYHSADVTLAIRGVSFIVTRQPGELVAYDEPEVTVSDTPGGPPLRLVPKVGRNKPCPCGSQKKYKKCHGV